MLPESAISGLNAFVLYFALPCLLMRFGMNTPVFELLNPAVLAVYLASALLIVFVVVATSLNERVSLRNAAAARRALKGALSNPLPWSIAAGALLSVAGWTLPGPVDSAVAMLAGAATPVALFTIGAVLWRAEQHTHARTAVVDFVPVALIKLFMHPLLVFLLAAGARQLGATLSVFQITALTLAAALPSASSVSLLAERYGADNGRIARIIMTSTVLAFVSFSALAWLFGVKPAT